MIYDLFVVWFDQMVVLVVLPEEVINSKINKDNGLENLVVLAL